MTGAREGSKIQQRYRLGFGVHRQLSELVSSYSSSSMANRTDPTARSVHGTNPQNLVEKILRSKIYQNTYWKEQCFGLTGMCFFPPSLPLLFVGVNVALRVLYEP